MKTSKEAINTEIQRGEECQPFANNVFQEYFTHTKFQFISLSSKVDYGGR